MGASEAAGWAAESFSSSSAAGIISARLAEVDGSERVEGWGGGGVAEAAGWVSASGAAAAGFDAADGVGSGRVGEELTVRMPFPKILPSSGALRTDSLIASSISAEQEAASNRRLVGLVLTPAACTPPAVGRTRGHL